MGGGAATTALAKTAARARAFGMLKARHHMEAKLELAVAAAMRAQTPPHGYEQIWKQMQRDGRAKVQAPGARYSPTLKGRHPAYAPPTGFDVDSHYAFGFLSDYYCAGRIYDEPRRMRLSCTKNPVRKMNCKCKEPNRNSRQVPCRCEPAMGNGGVKKINLIDKFTAPDPRYTDYVSPVQQGNPNAP